MSSVSGASVINRRVKFLLKKSTILVKAYVILSRSGESLLGEEFNNRVNRRVKIYEQINIRN